MSLGRHEKFERDCDAALAWIARFRSDAVADADRQAFALWLEADPDHGRAMDQMQDLWDDLGSLKHLPEHDLPHDTGRRRWLGASLAVAASLVAALVLVPQWNAPETSERYLTALGERSQVDLADGSRINLNTNSALTIRYSEALRHVSLERGEAFFEVATDATRPFVVDTGSARVSVVGTAFNIRRSDEHRSVITVAEGVVRVSERDAPSTRAASTEVLRANQRLETSQQGFATSGQVDIAPSLAWRRGELLAREMPLVELASELERYHDQHFLITDPQLATLPVSGVFQLDHLPSVLGALERSLDIQVARLDEHTLRLLPASQ
ncbi:FecR family protein [Parahaliea mediterranea]|uniref:FecR domain-containing protein n=1 Tax=Parahaliea mediterranea TaxID=651086 RepID=A0A939IPG2_9GAMM|nr:FecR domain-containing protein [Parahaliea mediterranea]MBN7799022.1 FecR domain-containing protein [Parahaliea mediterranea]